jgi:hypothetical protein
LRGRRRRPLDRRHALGLLPTGFLGPDRIRCELRDHGAHGIEAQYFRNEEFTYSRRFDAWLDPPRTPRELAIQWAEAERRALEAGATGHENQT